MFTTVTGVAGFIGSHLAEALVRRGDRVIGVDCFTDYYDPREKRANLTGLLSGPRFELVEADLRTAELGPLVEESDVIFHQAGQPGVRRSWSAGFTDYCGHNILATQRLLEAASRAHRPRFVYASSSSIYGNAPAYPTTEADLPAPFSPYGVTKLAAEHLCGLYAANWGVPTVSLRYFTVYGPRQRPDMAMRRLVDSVISGETFRLNGTGEQVRDFTYVTDVVAANLAAASCGAVPGAVVNVSGGSHTSLNDVIALIEELAERPVAVERREAQPGDVQRTGGSIEFARRILGWQPQVELRAGLQSMLDWAPRRPSAGLKESGKRQRIRA